MTVSDDRAADPSAVQARDEAGHYHWFHAFWSHFGQYGPQDVHYHPCCEGEPGDCWAVIMGAGLDCGGPGTPHERMTLTEGGPQPAEALKRLRAASRVPEPGSVAVTEETPGPYSIGSNQWPGLSRIIEEAGELLQVAGKLIGSGGTPRHYDGTDLGRALADEMADVIAAVRYFRAHSAPRLIGDLDCDGIREYIDRRADEKFSEYQRWDREGRRHG